MARYVLDIETMYDSKAGYTLKKMTTEEYINDPRFKLFGMCVSKDGGEPVWVPESKMKRVLKALKLHEHTVICHNSAFDIAALAWHYGVRPKRIVDTLSMCRGLFGTIDSNSLSAVCERLGLGQKGGYIENMDGVRELTPEIEEKLASYCKQDAALTWKLYKQLIPQFPATESVIVDLTVRMFTEPVFELDAACIDREIELADKRREDLLARAGCTIEDLRSDAKFAKLLIELGVDPPKKLSAKLTAKRGEPVHVWAFAKSDADFKALLQHENELVKWASEARIGLKSTIKESRAQRFKSIQERFGRLPIALDYYGAGTGRYSASSSAKVNAQNLPAIRGSKDPDAGLLRKSMRAPAGHKIVVVDASQIEARFVAWLAGQNDLVESFAQGRDVYSEMATNIFSRPVDRKKNPDDYIPGFIGKCVVLGCGYGLGMFKFAQMIYAGMLGGPSVLFGADMAKQLSIDVNRFADRAATNDEFAAKLEGNRPAAVSQRDWIVHCACAQKIIRMYRSSNPMIEQLWGTCDLLIDAMYNGEELQFGPLRTGKNCVWLPNGMRLQYRDLERDENGRFSYLRRKEGRVQRVGIYGGSLTENFCVDGDSLVLTENGWTPLKHIGLARVHDGVEFVSHGGVMYKGVKPVICVDGVWMTPDHEVLDERENWTEASQLSRPYRPAIRNADRLASVLHQRKKMGMDVSLRVWRADREGGCRSNEAGVPQRDSQLRVHDPRANKQSEYAAWDEQASCVCRVAVDVRPLSTAYASGVEKLRRAWHHGLRAVARILRELLGGHGADVPVWANVGPYGQREGVWAGELPLDYAQGAGSKYAQYADHFDAGWKNASKRGRATVWDKPYYDSVQTEQRMAGGAFARSTEPEKSVRVFDIVNCGPRSRFVVLGENGPFIVHNCQALAGAYVKEAMARMWVKYNIRTVLQVHDEVVAIVKEEEAEQAFKRVMECMTTVPAWAAGLPLAAEGDIADSYGEAKG